MSTFELAGNWQLKLYHLGLDTAEVLRRANLPLHLFQKRPPIISEDEYFRLFEAMASTMANEPFGLAYINKIPIEAQAPALLHAMSSKDFNAAIAEINRFNRLITPLLLKTDINSTGTVIEIFRRGSEPLSPVLGLTMLIEFVHIIRAGTKKEITPLWVTVADTPKWQSEYEDFFGVRLRRGPRYSLAFTATDASRPFVTANQELMNLLSTPLEQRLDELERNNSLEDRVRESIHQLLPDSSISVDKISSKLGLGVRSLQRQLADENTTFKQVLNETRKEMARYYLANTDMTTGEIAYLLGFKDATSFFRAFKTWTGQTPKTYRESV